MARAGQRGVREIMKRIHLLLSFLLMSFVSICIAAECTPPKMSIKAKEILKPLMELRNRQAKEQFTDDGRWRGESAVSPQVEERFYAILNNKSRAGDEAIAYLLTVYMGEHPGEELVCESINRGRRMLPLVKAYHRCQPTIGVEPLHKFVQGSGVLPPEVIEAISKGRKCENEE
jgi:hypothetical protein